MAKAMDAKAVKRSKAKAELKAETEAELATQPEEETALSESAPEEPKTAEEAVVEEEASEKTEKPASETTEESEKSIPYGRFQEVNAKYRLLEQAYSDLLTKQSQPDVSNMDAREYADYVAANSEARAREATRQESDVQRQQAEAYRAYPELDPNDGKFNPAFEEAVVGVIMTNRQTNRQDSSKWLSAKQAADKVAELGKYFKAQGERQALEEVQTKSGAGKIVGGKGTQPSPEDMTLEELEKILPKADSYFRPAGKKR